jgi:hypothetical protein
MTTLINFDPASTANFQFNPVLDGITYTAICTYNLYAPRYYVNIYDNNGTLIVTRPIIASPDNYDIDIVEGYFTTSKLIYRTSSRNFEVIQ